MVAHTGLLFTSVPRFLSACMLTGMRRKRRMLKPCKNAAKNCLTTLYLYKQTAKAAPRGPGPGEEPSGGYSGVLELCRFQLCHPQNSLFTPWPLQLFKPGPSIWVFDQRVTVNLAPMDLTRKATVHIVTVLCQYEHCAVSGVKKRWAGGHIGLGKFYNWSFLHGSKKKRATSFLKLYLWNLLLISVMT